MPRPEKKIDWKYVDELLMAGCLGTEIAANFDMHPNTFYDRVVAKYKMSFTDYSTQKRQLGHSLLRKKQFDKAIKGDNSMLIWLGKNLLKQSENPEVSLNENTITQFTALMIQLESLQSERKIDKTSIKKEQKS